MTLTIIFKQVVALSLMGSGWAIVILMIKGLFRRKLGASWQYYIWFLLILRLLIPFVPESSFSFLTVFPQFQQSGTLSQFTAHPYESVTDLKSNIQISQPDPVTKNSSRTNENPFPLFNSPNFDYQHLAVLWLSGCLLISLYILVVNISLLRKFRNRPALNRPEIMHIVEECKAQLQVNSKVGIVSDVNLKSPALYGLINPKILISPEIADQLSSAELRYVFLHELAHLKRKDLWINAFAMFIQIIYWFNPLIWFSFYRMKQDCELACDATVLTSISPEENRAYAQAIINLLRLLSKPHWAPGTLGFASKYSKRRIIMISSFRKGSLKWTILALILTLLVGCSGLTTPPKIDNQPSKTETGTVTPGQPDAGKDSSSQIPGDTNQGSNTTTHAQTDTQKTLLTTIMQLANQGKVINCDFAAKTTVIDTVIQKWGNPDKTDWVPDAKGNYATYSKHGAVFGYNKGAQIFEVRTFDNQLSQISLSKARQVFGAPAYDVKSNGEEIIGYTAGNEFKLLLVFPQPTSNTPNPVLVHYSVLYPQGTVNLMSGDPGRQW